MLQVGDWVVVDLQGRKFKGYILRTSSFESLVNVYIPNLQDYSPHMYGNSKITPALLDTFENEKDLYIDGALLLGCKQTFMEVMNSEQIK